MEKREKTLKSRLIHQGRVIRVYEEEVLLPDGKRAKRDIVRHRGACAILAVNGEEIVLIRQFRKALEKEIYEIPAGGLEAGEEIAVCAKRELNEETGYEAQTWQYLTGMISSPGFCDEVIHLFLATDICKAEERAHCDDDEFIDVQLVHREKVKEMIRTGEIIDGKTICAFLMYEMMR